jgi:hypothetical protein
MQSTMPDRDVAAQLLAELAVDGWCDMAPPEPARPNEWVGRVCVHRVECRRACS